MKIQLPIDTSAVSFTDVMPPEPVLDRQSMPVTVTGLMVADLAIGTALGSRSGVQRLSLDRPRTQKPAAKPSSGGRLT